MGNKSPQSESRLEKSAREGSNAPVSYEVQARTTHEKTARLRALRLAKEAADQATGNSNGNTRTALAGIEQ